MAYRFAASDYVEFNIAPFTGYVFGPLTMAIFLQRSVISTADQPLQLTNSSLTALIDILLHSGNTIRHRRSAYINSTLTATSTSLWYLIVVTAPNGSTTPRFHVHDGTSWTHYTPTGTYSNLSAIVGTDRLQVGSTISPFEGDVVCAGIKKSDSNDAAVETLTRTDFADWQAFGFDWLIGFDSSLESAGVLQDQGTAGTGDEIAISGTTAVSDPAGWSWPAVGAAPVAAFSGTPLSGDAPLNVAFTDASTNTPTSWAWDFGDSATSTSQNPSHTYTVAGTYTVELDATNAFGTDNEAKVAYVTVDAPPAIEGFSVAFDDTPMTANPTWTRIDTLTGCHVQEYTIDRGRPTEFDKTDTGTAVVRLIDREGLFDPTNFSSPYNGLILPGKQAAIALQNPVSDEWFTLFRGFIESWHYRLDQTRQYMELELQLVDGFAILARAMLIPGEHGATAGPPPYTSPPYASDEAAEAEQALAELAAGNVVYGETLGSVGEDRITGILEDVGWPDGLRDVFTGNVKVGPKAYGPGTSALDAIWDAVDAEFPGVANCWISKEGVFVFHGRQARFHPEVAEYNINERTVADPSGYGISADVVPLSELEWSNGQDNLFNAASATPQWVGSGASIRQWNPGPPDNDSVQDQYVKAGDPGLTADPDSIEKYGLRSITFDQLQTVKGIALGNDSKVETVRFAVYYVENYSTPAPRVSRMVFKSRRPGNTHGSALWVHLTRVEISDLLTLQSEHPGGGGFTEDQFYVEGIHYTVRPGPPTFPIVELSLDVSPRAHYTTNPFDEDEDP